MNMVFNVKNAYGECVTLLRASSRIWNVTFVLLLCFISPGIQPFGYGF